MKNIFTADKNGNYFQAGIAGRAGTDCTLRRRLRHFADKNRGRDGRRC